MCPMSVFCSVEGFEMATTTNVEFSGSVNGLEESYWEKESNSIGIKESYKVCSLQSFFMAGDFLYWFWKYETEHCLAYECMWIYVFDFWIM